MMDKKRSFTLVEILIVLAIIVTIAAISIPNIQRQRHNANERRAIMMIRSIVVAQLDYRSHNPTYAYFKEADPGEGLLDSDPPYLRVPGYDSSEQGTSNGIGYANYVFVFMTAPSASGFTMDVWRDQGLPGASREFWTNQEGTIYYCNAPCDPRPNVNGVLLDF